ncbi:NAD(P)/FAD-dependent oxidoreductase [Ramlibacter sp.]|uniref:NAD(P)/FAD-dependent oxidoreductase n=1 Tax=Ramlibacter sp. TaxID=1917967 RepID=UPI003D10185E
MTATTECDLAVIGAGMTGLSATLHGAQRGLAVTCFESQQPCGGLVANVGALDGWPSPAPLAGQALAAAYVEEATKSGARWVDGAVRSLRRDRDGWLLDAGNGAVRARRVILATGARLRRLGIPGEAELEGRGVSQCVWCDGGLYRQRRVLVVGGGDAALQGARYLARLGAEVSVAVRGPDLRARSSQVGAAADMDNIAFLWETRVNAIHGKDGLVDSVTLWSSDDGDTTLPIEGVFILAGLVPSSDLVAGLATLDATGHVIVDSDFQTNQAGLFAAGAVRSGFLGDLACAVGEGAAAASRVARATLGGE